MESIWVDKRVRAQSTDTHYVSRVSYHLRFNLSVFFMVEYHLRFNLSLFFMVEGNTRSVLGGLGFWGLGFWGLGFRV